MVNMMTEAISTRPETACTEGGKLNVSAMTRQTFTRIRIIRLISKALLAASPWFPDWIISNVRCFSLP